MPAIIQPTEQQKKSEFAELLEKQEKKAVLEEGSVVKGKVVHITQNYVVVDIGFKSEGRISVQEFKDKQGEVQLKVGDSIEVLIDRIEDEQGLVALSKERADTFKAWDTLVKTQEEGGTVEGLVMGKVRGGLVVDVGVKAFLPASQIDFKPVKNLDRLLGKRFRFKILTLNKRRGNIVLSRKEVLEKEHGRLKGDVLQNIKEGQVVEGTVKNVTDYGAFVDLGGIDGLLHVTDMSWGRVSHPSQLFSPGDPIKVKVLKIDEANQRVSLGVKQLQEDPWQGIEGKFPVGSKIKGKITSLADYGAFVELSPGVEGLVHISEISWNKKLKHPSQELTPGQEVEAIVMDCDPAAHRVALGMKQLKPNPWEVLEGQCPVGSKVQGVVRNTTDFGIFVDCGVGVDGLVHISDMSWVQNFSHPEEIYKRGDKVEAVVLNIDREQERFSLGLKQLQPNPWEKIKAEYSKGTQVKGKIIGCKTHGALIQLEKEVVGFFPKAPADLKEGETIECEVETADEESRKFYLKLKP